MNEEEKQAIKYFYNLRATIDESNMLFDEDINIKCGKEMIKQITTVLNLLEKKDINIIEAKEANRQLSIELQKKDKIIDEMANSFAEEGFYSEHCQTLIDNDICPDDCNKCVKQYYERKVENG